MYTEVLGMKKGQQVTVKDLIEQYDGISIKENKDKKLLFRMYMTRYMKEIPIDSLELSQRSYHCLRRAGYDTIGQLTDALSSGVSLKSVRNCGKKSIREIQEKLFLFQYHSLQDGERTDYIKEVLALNAVKALLRREENA